MISNSIGGFGHGVFPNTTWGSEVRKLRTFNQEMVKEACG